MLTGNDRGGRRTAKRHGGCPILAKRCCGDRDNDRQHRPEGAFSRHQPDDDTHTGIGPDAVPVARIDHRRAAIADQHNAQQRQIMIGQARHGHADDLGNGQAFGQFFGNAADRRIEKRNGQNRNGHAAT